MHVITPAARAQDCSGTGGSPDGVGWKTRQLRLKVATAQVEGGGGAAGTTSAWAAVA